LPIRIASRKPKKNKINLAAWLKKQPDFDFDIPTSFVFIFKVLFQAIKTYHIFLKNQIKKPQHMLRLN